MLAPDLLAQQTIAAALAELQARDDLVDQVFEGFDTTIRDKVKAWLDTAEIDVRLGWTQQSPKMPCVAITMPSEQESQQYVGSDPGDQWETDDQEWVPASFVDESIGAYSEAQIAQFAGSVDAAIYSLNATETTWLAAMVKWSYLRNRRALEGAGLFEQRITMTDFMPASDYPQPDPAYTRVVKLSYQTLVNYTIDNADPDAMDAASQYDVINLADQ